MAKTRQDKEQALADLKDKMGRMESLIFTKYQGLTVKDVTDLRRSLRTEQIDMVVAKKTLLRLALQDAGQDPAMVDQLTGDLALAFGYADAVAPAKLLQAFAKTHPSVQLLGGVVQGKWIDAQQAVALSKLPSREELLARTVGAIKSPVSGFVQVLSGTMRGFIQVLQAYKDSRPATAGN